MFLTDHADVPSSVRAMKAGAVDFLQKPVNEQQLLDTLQRALKRASEVRTARIIPTSRAMSSTRGSRIRTWDDSVTSLVFFPQVLTLMDQKLDWVRKLGDASLAQQKDLLDAVQRLRARAQKEGNLKSTAEQKVTVEAGAAPAPARPRLARLLRQRRRPSWSSSRLPR